MSVHLAIAKSAADVELVRVLFREYADSLGVDLGYQDFDTELRDLPGDYVPPAGLLLLAWNGAHAAGCVGVVEVVNIALRLKLEGRNSNDESN